MSEHISDYNRIVRCTTLTPSKIQELNDMRRKNPSQRILVEIPNTKGISSELLEKLSPRISIRIAGAYDKKLVERRKGVRYVSGETGQYYTDAVIYTKYEAVEIVSAMEEIEKGFEGQNFSKLEKFIHIYDKLKAGVMYDPKFEGKPSSEIRSLRGFITGQTVCAGYSVMLKEMMDRQGIECHYVEGMAGREGHAWNVVSFDGQKYHPIDLTWENSKFRSRSIEDF